MLPMPDILTHRQQNRATQVVSSIKFKLSHAMLIWVMLTIDIAMIVFLVFSSLGFGQRGENALERGGGDRKDGAKKSDNKT